MEWRSFFLFVFGLVNKKRDDISSSVKSVGTEESRRLLMISLWLFLSFLVLSTKCWGVLQQYVTFKKEEGTGKMADYLYLLRNMTKECRRYLFYANKLERGGKLLEKSFWFFSFSFLLESLCFLCSMNSNEIDDTRPCVPIWSYFSLLWCWSSSLFLLSFFFLDQFLSFAFLSDWLNTTPPLLLPRFLWV